MKDLQRQFDPIDNHCTTMNSEPASRAPAAEALARALVEFPKAPLEWGALFARPAPIHVEVGSGKGRFLIRAAQASPAINWVGLERRWSSLAVATERIIRSQIGNVVVVRCDALEVIRSHLPEGSIAAFHVYYPDPWWKVRHAKRRVFTPAFLGDLARGLIPGGELRIATDVPGYFEAIAATVAATGLFAPYDLDPEAWSPDGEPLTSYEAKYVARGRSPNRAAYRRTGLAPPPAEPWTSRKPHSAPLGERLILPRLL